MGLLGSKHFVANPTVPIEDIRAVINFDMIGRLRPDRFVVFGVSSAEEFDDLVRRSAERVGLEYRAPEAQTGNSDHASFMYKEIPYLFPFTGVHKDYHRPSDDWDKIDTDGAVKVLKMMYPIVYELANLETGPAFHAVDAEAAPEDFPTKPAAEYEKEYLEAAGGDPYGLTSPDEVFSPHGDSPPSSQPTARANQPTAHAKRRGHPGGKLDEGVDQEVGRPRRPKVRFGIIPDHVPSSTPGVGIDTVLDGGPAKAAGMKSGDRILRIDEYEITDLYAYMAALKNFKAGTVLNVVVLRDGKERNLKVKLKGERRQPGQK
jgi:hypothetical protein